MLELIKHTLGFCGESHFNLFHLLIMGNLPIIFSIHTLKYYINKITKK
jgi:hypothetical protein